jgi:hypothetical protein
MVWTGLIWLRIDRDLYRVFIVAVMEVRCSVKRLDILE